MPTCQYCGRQTNGGGQSERLLTAKSKFHFFKLCIYNPENIGLDDIIWGSDKYLEWKKRL